LEDRHKQIPQSTARLISVTEHAIEIVVLWHWGSSSVEERQSTVK